MEDLNNTTIVGRLTRDPELRALPGGSAVCSIRLAFNTSKKNGQTGEWEDKGNFINVTVFGAQGEAMARNLTKGQRLGVNGRLEHREWEDKDNNKRESIELIANRCHYLDPKADSAGGGQQAARPAQAKPQATPAPSADSVPF